MALWELSVGRLDEDTPLYEVLMRYPKRRRSRLTDRLPQVGDRLETHGKTWEVVRVERVAGTTSRFVCELTRGGHTKATPASRRSGFRKAPPRAVDWVFSQRGRETGGLELAILGLLERHGPLAFEQIAAHLNERPNDVRRELTTLRDSGFVHVITLDGHSSNAISNWRLTDAGRRELDQWNA